MTHNQDFIPIILAAGKGTRLDPRQRGLSKALIEINGKPLLFHHFDNLLNLGFQETILVIGYKAKSFKEIVGNTYKELKINYVINKEFNKSGTAWSLFITQREWSVLKKQVLFLHGDVFYDPSILDKVLNDQRSDLIVLDENYSVKTKDEMVVLGDKDKVTSIFKGVPKEGTILGEVLGINKWSPSFMEQFYKLFSIHKHKYGINLHWEIFLGDLLAFSNEDNMEFLGIEGMSWVNINYKEDLQEAKSFNF